MSSSASPGTEAKLSRLLPELLSKLSPRRKKHLLGLLALMIVSAFAEVISLGAVLPFIGALTSPEQFMSHPMVSPVLAGFEISAMGEFIVAATVAFCVAALIAGLVRILMIRVSTRLAYSIGADLGIQIYTRTLHQPYEVHKSRNSSEVISGVTRKVDGVVVGIINPCLTLISSSIIFVAILAALLFIDWQTALAAAAIFGTAYITIAVFTRRRLRANGVQIASKQTRVFKALNEGLNGIRDVLLNHLQEFYARDYRRSDIPLRRAQGDNLFFALSPRYAMEALGMVLIALLAFSLVTSKGADSALPVLAALAVGAQRMLPTLQQGYAGLSTIIGYRAVLADAIDLLNQPLPRALVHSPSPLELKSEIQFDAVSFTYAGADTPVLSKVGFKIKKGARVGFVGPTGSGKSTAIDLLMGLLKPSSGQILVDGVALNESNMASWQANIAHVPQTIFLSDGTFAENIALGEDQSEIDYDRVRIAAAQGQIAEFIEAQDNGYDALVGENGGRLSGGQRQRIGIARALYRRAKVIVFDEATSALDTATEEAVIESVGQLDPDITVVMIAHRTSTLKSCSLIIELDQGRIFQTGSFAEVLGSREATANSSEV